MARWKRVGGGILIVLGGLVLLGLVAVVVVTNSPWGREQVRGFVVGQLNEIVDGEAEIGRIGGNLLAGGTLHEVSITGPEGDPFVVAREVEWRHSLSGFLRQRVVLTRLVLRDAELVLSQRPDDEWNFIRIFNVDPDAEEDPDPGWGSWVELRDFRTENVSVTVRTPWAPDEELEPAARAEEIRRARAGETLERVVEVPGGFQTVMEFRQLDADLPRLVVAHPDSAKVPIEIASLSGLAEPFRSPEPGIVENLSGTLRVGGDSLVMEGVEARLPGTVLSADGVFVTETGNVLAALEANPFTIDDFRFLYPPLPSGVSGEGTARIQVEGTDIALAARDLAIRIGEGRIEGRLNVAVGEHVAVSDTDLHFEAIRTRFLEEIIPDLDLPRHGELSGRIAAHSEATGAGSGAFDRAPADEVLPAGRPVVTPPTRLDALVRFADEDGGISQVTLQGEVELDDTIRLEGVTVRADPIQANLIAAAAPELALRGQVEGSATLHGAFPGMLRLESDFAHSDPEAGVSRLAAAATVEFPEEDLGELRIVDGLVRLDPLRLDLFRDEVDAVPPRSMLAGDIAISGSPSGWLDIDGDLTLTDPATGSSRVMADGRLRIADDPSFDDFVVGFDPVQVGLLRTLDPELPMEGILSGEARLDGSLERGLQFRASVVHREDLERVGGLTAEGVIATAGEGRLDAFVEIDDLSLPAVGRFVPEAELRGRLSGRVEARGTFAELHARADLSLPEDGRLEVEGVFHLDDELPAMDVDLRLARIDLSALSGRIDEETSIGGESHVRLAGTDPAEMAADFRIDLEDDAVEGDPRRLQGAGGVSDGLLAVEGLEFRTSAIEADLHGSFGLVDHREGIMELRVAVDSLRVLSPFVPDDDGTVEPRAAVRDDALRARQDELRQAVRAAQVEYLATGERMAFDDEIEVPGMVGIRRDDLRGHAELSGVVEGHIHAFDAAGDLVAGDLVVLGHRIGRAQAAWAVGMAGPDSIEAGIEMEAEDLIVAGFGYEHAVVRADYRGTRSHSGSLALTVRQDPETGIAFDGTFEVDDQSGRVVLEELALTFEEAEYAMPEPGEVRWSGGVLAVEDVALRSDDAGSFVVAGRMPVREEEAAEPGELGIRLERFEVGPLVHLLQMREGVEGVLDLEVDLAGTLAEPAFEGSLLVSRLEVDGEPLPELRAGFEYTDRRLALDAAAHQEGASFLTADAVLPVDLGFVDVETERVRDDPIEVDVRLEDFRLENLPALTDQVEDVAGSVDGELAIRGTFEAPMMEGALTLDVPTLHLVPLGIRATGISGALAMEDNVIRVDSLVAWSRGPLRMTGAIDLRELDAPAFDLELRGTDVRVMDTEDVRLRVDADLVVTGPLEAVELNGEVRTRQGVIWIPTTEELAEAGPFDLEDPALRDYLDPVLMAEIDRVLDVSPLLENLRIDLDLQIDRGLWVRSTELNLELFTPPAVGPLSVRMTGLRVQDLQLDGTVESERGEYEFMGRRFALTRGSVTFVGGATMDPLIRLTAEHEVQMPGREAFDIRIVLDGTLADLETEIESSAEPPLSQTDLLSLVVFGRDAGSLLQQHGSGLTGQGSSGGPLVGAVATRAAQQFATVGLDAVMGELESETARALRLDVLNIRPADFPAEISTGEFLDVLRGTEVEAGRYVTPRVFVSGQARPTFVHPGARLDYETEHGWVWRVTWRPRFLPAVPTLAREAPDRASVFGSLIFREWRF